MIMNRRFRHRPENAAPDPQLMKELKETMGTIDTVTNHFEQVLDPTLIDCYIYELKAAQLRYQFLLRRIKKQELNF